MQRAGRRGTRLLVPLAAASLFIGCSEGPATREELDAEAALQRLHARVEVDANQHAVALEMVGQQVRDDDLAPLGQLHDLKKVLLANSTVGDGGLAHLAGLGDLKLLSLRGTKVTDQGLAQLKSLSSLEQLDLSDLPITDAGLAQLASITSLRRVYVNGSGTTQAGIDALRSQNPRVQVSRQ